MQVDRRTRFAREISGPGRRHQEDAIPLLGDLLHRKRNRVDNGVDALIVEPTPCNRGADVGLVLVVSVDDLNRFARGLSVEVLHRHARSFNRTLT